MTKQYLILADDVIDNLTSTDTSAPLSAKQGKVLNDTKQKAITVSTSEPTSSEGSDGDIWMVYSA